MRWFLQSVGLVLCFGTATGCGHALYALPGENQQVVGSQRWLLDEADGVRVSVRPVAVPWDTDDELMGFAAEIVNSGPAPITVRHRDFVLISAEGLRRAATDPADLDAGFANANMPAELRFAVASGYGRCRPHYSYPRRPYAYRYRGRMYRYDCYPYGYRGFFSYGGYPYWYDSYYDASYYAEIVRERTRQFLSLLWRDETIEPDEAHGGNVVFAWRPARDEIVTLRVTLRPAGQAVQEADADASTELTFRFEYR